MTPAHKRPQETTLAAQLSSNADDSPGRISQHRGEKVLGWQSNLYGFWRRFA